MAADGNKLRDPRGEMQSTPRTNRLAGWLADALASPP